MWVPVEWGCGAGGADAAGAAPAPCARCKHAAAALGEHVYVLGGRGAGGSLPLKDVWRYSLVERRWQRLECRGEAPPALQQHSCTPHGAALYVFGGETAANSDTPLWRLDTQTLMWRHISSPVQAVARRRGRARPAAGAGSAGAAPRGRRGHSAHALNDCLLIYGGYMDLRGSSNELWAFHYESETWSLVRTATPGPARHRHAGCVRGARLYVHGGQCDLRDANDLWHYDTISRVWAVARLARGARAPGARSGHVAAAAGNYLYIFGGEADGQPTNEMWRFHFETEMWERIVQSAQWPSPRAHCCALLLRGASADPGDSGGEDEGEAERGEQAPPSPRRAAPPASLLREISKLSSFHLRRANRCSYSALGGGGDSSESLPRDAPALPKSHSAYVLVRRRAAPEPAEPAEPGPREADLPPRRLAREPISVPDFADMVLPTPVLSPAEATKLVYLDSEEEEELRREAGAALAARCGGGERGGERALGFSNPHYLCGDVRALGQALTPDSGVGAELEMRELRPAQTAVAPAANPAPRAAARPAPAPRPALRLLLLGGKGAGHAAGLHSPLSMWTYRLQ